MKNKNITKNKKIVREIMEENGLSEGIVKLIIKICSDNNIVNIKEQIHKFYYN